MEHWFTKSYPDPLPEELAGGLKRLAMDIIQTLLLSVVLYLVINAATARITVRSVSMQPTLFEQDFVLVNKLVYHFDAPQRGDVIVFDPAKFKTRSTYLKPNIYAEGMDYVLVNGKFALENGKPTGALAGRVLGH